MGGDGGASTTVVWTHVCLQRHRERERERERSLLMNYGERRFWCLGVDRFYSQVSMFLPLLDMGEGI